MSWLSNVENNLDTTMNYINNIRYYCNFEDNKNKEGLTEEILKELEITLENLYSILKELLDIHNHKSNLSSNKVILTNIRELLIISDKGVGKLGFIDKFHKKLLYDNVEYDKRMQCELLKVVECLEDIHDELYQYISYQ